MRSATIARPCRICRFFTVVGWATLAATQLGLLSPDSLITRPEMIGMPDISLMLAEEVVIFDNLAGALTIVINADCTSPDAYHRAIARLDDLEAQLLLPATVGAGLAGAKRYQTIESDSLHDGSIHL